MTLPERLKQKLARLGVIGAGYVGLPLAVEKAKKGFKTFLWDTNDDKIDQLQAGHSYIPDVKDEDLKNPKLIPCHYLRDLNACHVITICVPTPLTADKRPDTSYIETVVNQLKRAFNNEGKLIILESTTYPGTTRKLLGAAFPEALVAYSPERVNPASHFPQWDIPRIVSGLTPEATVAAVALFQHLSKVVKVVDTPEIAEMSKLFENTFRNVNINLCNEMLIVCRSMGIDPWQMFEAAYTKPYAVMEHWPGLIGGHCIPVDPYYLQWVVKRPARWLKSHTPILDTALKTQEAYPDYIADRWEKIARTKHVMIVGTTYKANVPDQRESPAFLLEAILKKRGFTVSLYDPLLEADEVIFTEIILLQKHTLPQMDYRCLASASLILDVRNLLKVKDPRVVVL